MADSFKITEAKGSLTIQGDVFKESTKSTWQLQSLKQGVYVLEQANSRAGMGGRDAGLARCSAELFADFLVGIHQRQWSGVVSIDLGSSIKKIFFEQGEITFAASNMIDDRLGEVIYRDGMITLDRLTDTAVKVDRNSKFGQVLLASGIFSNNDLWGALKRQVQEIVYSLFLVDRVYFELQPGRGLAPTNVIFLEGTRRVLEDAIGFGAMYRDFVSRIDPEAQILPTPQLQAAIPAGEGTFAGDLISIINDAKKVREIIGASKLSETNTALAIMGLMSHGLCQVELGGQDPGSRDPELSPLKGRLDAYSWTLRTVRKGFVDSGKSFPLPDLRRFATDLSPFWICPLYLDQEGEIARGSRYGMFAQCIGNRSRISYFSLRIESLIQFALQMAGDILPQPKAREIRAQYSEMLT